MIKVYGASDDLIEVEVDGKSHDEYGAFGDATFMHFDCGVVLRCEYAPDEGDYGGNWKIEAVKKPKGVKVKIEHVAGQDGEDEEKQDIAYINAPLKWVFKSDDDTISNDEMRESLSNADWDDADFKDIESVFAIALKCGAIRCP